jgi:hypothetical protein
VDGDAVTIFTFLVVLAAAVSLFRSIKYAPATADPEHSAHAADHPDPERSDA